jgi:hypothetical protein
MGIYMRQSIIIIIILDVFVIFVVAAALMLDALQPLMFLVGTLTYLKSKRFL